MPSPGSPKTMNARIEQALASTGVVVEATAHATLVQGNCVSVNLATGATEAPANNDRLIFLGVVIEGAASGARTRVKISGYAQVLSGAAITLGQLCDVSADMKADPLGTQTDGNGTLKAIEAASGADELTWCEIL